MPAPYMLYQNVRQDWAEVGDMVDVKMVALLPGDPELEFMSKY
jgi:hypothetical protein